MLGPFIASMANLMVRELVNKLSSAKTAFTRDREWARKFAVEVDKRQEELLGHIRDAGGEMYIGRV